MGCLRLTFFSFFLWIIVKTHTHITPSAAHTCWSVYPQKLVFTSTFSLSVSTCRWRTLPGSSDGWVVRLNMRPVSLAHCLLSMRPLYQWGKDSISQKTSPPYTQSPQCSCPTAHEWELSDWLKTLLCSLWQVSFYYFCFFLSLLVLLSLSWLHQTLTSCQQAHL